MTDRPQDPADTALDVADRKMLADIKASVLGTDQEDFRIGRFRVLEHLGEGSMGIVFAGVDDRLQRRVALKLLHQGLGASEQERKARMLREAQVLAQLDHPNVVQVYEAGEHEGQVFMAMELVAGRPLDELQREHPPAEWKALLGLYLQAGRGLAAAHAEGVVHRDFKPHNVLVDDKGKVRVVDFGLARGTVTDEPLTAELLVADEGAIERAGVERLTATGAVPGTPAYMAPELFDGQTATAASDQFSFCVALYEAMYGRRPFEGMRLHDLVTAAKEGRILPAPEDRPVPKWVFRVLVRGLAPTPEQRFSSMEALLAELERDRMRRWKQVGTVAGLLLVGGVVGLLVARKNDSAEAERARAAQAERARAAAVERSKICDSQAAELRKRWTEARAVAPARADDEDVDGLIALLDVGANGFFDLWERSCREDVDESSSQCRKLAASNLDAMLFDAPANLHQDGFHHLTLELELCLEEGASPCGSPEPDPAAIDALGRARAANQAERSEEALTEIEHAIELAKTSADETTRLRAMLLKGAIQESAGLVAEARWTVEQTLRRALICRAHVLAIDAALEGAEAEILHFGGKAEHADDLLEVTRLILEQPGIPELPLRRARLLEKEGGSKLYLQDDCVHAVPLLREALRLREQAVAEHQTKGLPTNELERLVANALLNLANAEYQALDDYSDFCTSDDVDAKEVIDHYRKARARFIASAGVTHPELADFDHNLGLALVNFGDIDEGITYFTSALAINTEHHGRASPVSGDSHRALAEAYRKSGALAEAKRHAKTNLDIRLVNQEEEGQRLALAEAHDALGVILYEQESLDEARDEVAHAIEILDHSDLTDLTLNETTQLHFSHVNLASIEHARGDRTATKNALSRARELHEALDARSSEEYPIPAKQILIEARVLLDEGRAGEALELLKTPPAKTSRRILDLIETERKRAIDMQ